jgi:3-oxoacyl-[acyl-carrier-protein] synthase-3
VLSIFGKNIGVALGSQTLNIKRICEKKFGLNKTLEILKKTGPLKTYKCKHDEDTLTLSLKAWKSFKKKNKNFKIKNIKNLIYITETNRLNFPGNGYLFSSKIKLNEKINIYDVNSGCTGFIDGIKIANKLCGDTLIVCAEAYSKNIPYFQRSISTIFSDGSSIFFFEKKKLTVQKEISIFKKNSFLDLKCLNNKIEMDGKKVFDFVLSEVFPQIDYFLKQNNHIKAIFFHQASKVVCDQINNRFKKTKILIPSNLIKRGNTVSATIPILINDHVKKYNFSKNDIILLVGFGVGLSMSAVMIRLKK